MAINTANLSRVSRTKGGTISLDISDLNAVMKQAARELDKTAPQVLRNVGGDFVDQLKRMTKKAPRMTKLFWFTGPGGQIMSRQKKEPSTPHGRGFARFTWQMAGEMAKIKRMKPAEFVPGTNKAAEGKITATAGNFSLILTNKTSYIEKLDKEDRIAASAVHNTTYKLLQQLTRNVNRQFKKAIVSTGSIKI